MRKLKLEIEPIPISTWGISLANRLEKKEWNEVRQKVYRDADYRCQICGGIDDKLNCHERWAFKKTGKNRGVQRLVGFICVCEFCHDCIHFGRSTQVYGKVYTELLMRRIEKINGMSRRQLLNYLEEVKQVSYGRVNVEWVVKVGRRILV